MENSSPRKLTRWPYLLAGVIAMLFAGIIYAWSILKAPLAAELGWSASSLALNFTLTMCFFCLGGFLGSLLAKKLGTKVIMVLGGALAGLGFVLTSRLSGSVTALYFTYGVMAGLGIGMVYVVTVSAVTAWFPDKKGFGSGCLMMGFGASTLVLGNLANALFGSIGWRNTFLLLGIVLGVVLIVAGLIIRQPDADTVLPQPKAAKAASREDFEPRDYTTLEMLRRPSFWKAFLCIVFLVAVGNSVISFARDLSLSVGASAALATTLVGVLSVCNGLGRIVTGAVFDVAGRRITMLAANLVAIAAAGITLVASLVGSLPLCIVGLCLSGLSYGTCPIFSSAFTSGFYGTKYFSTNFSVMNFNLMGASFIATASSALLSSYGSYVAPFTLLLALSVVGLILNLSIKRP